MRNKRLDILRCIAVITVMIHHAGVSYFFTRVGWIGVDLFFVLSGFLISGLLFSEYKKQHSISFSRFFIRRGLKIYPAFYAFLILTAVVAKIATHSQAPRDKYLHDIFFVMNYMQGVWDHTWTLGVEEHFYIFLPIFLFILMKLSSSRENPFRSIPQTAVVIAVLCLIFRLFSVFVGRPNLHMTYVGSHERMDSLFSGVLIGYYYHFRPMALETIMRPTRNRLAIAVVSLSLISTAYFYDLNTKFIATVGYAFIYVGFAGILLLSLYVQGILSGRLAWAMKLLGNAAAYVGMYSYSIYLWHGPTAAWLPGLFRRTLGFPVGEYGRFAVYFSGSLIIGIVMSKLVEYPILHLRDRILPAQFIVPVAAQVKTGPAHSTTTNGPSGLVLTRRD